MKRYWLFLLFIFTGISPLRAQKISLDMPAPLLSGARSDKSAGLIFFNGKYYAAWKEPGTAGQLHLAISESKPVHFLGTNDNPAAWTIAAPAFAAAGDYLFLFWIGKDSTVKYTSIKEGQAWEQAKIFDLPGEARNIKCTSGITAATSGGKIILATHADNKDRLRAVIIEPDGGILKNVVVTELKGARSASYPVICAQGKTVRFCWSRSGQMYWQDYDVDKEEGTKLKGQYAAPVNNPAALCTIGNKLLYIWSTREQQSRLQYLLSEDGKLTEAATDLPSYFETMQPVSLCAASDDGFLMVWPTADQQLYSAYGTLYHPASWMEDLLLPGREDYTLKDIVLPGAHDAGMSVLNGAGGKSTYTINECNTLTQLLPVHRQLEAGIRMFDLRIDLYQGILHAKHAPSDCMDDAVGGGYGERLDTILTAVSGFLDQHKKEFVILSFCHFCDRHMPVADQAKVIINTLGKDRVYDPGNTPLKDIPLKALAGKVLVTFEEHGFPGLGIVANTMTDRSDAFFNYKRAYAATNIPDQLITAEKAFFENLKGKMDANDIIRLDWQLTQLGQEAALTCSQFQSENSNLLLDGALLLTNAIKKNKSIINLALTGNRYLPAKLMDWIEAGTISKENKPNILYVDAAGNWITDFCVMLNGVSVYKK
jgi:hypothetical protein